jgi:hypothetical protein
VRKSLGEGSDYIRFSYTFVYTVVLVVKVLKSFKFDPRIYSSFKQLTIDGGYTVTGAFERFMNGCVESGGLVFPEWGVEGFEVEARVLVDWLRKGKHIYRGDAGVEVNISGRLVWLLPKVHDSKLRAAMEKALKGSVSDQG